MSLSSLGAQLASLHSKQSSANPGSLAVTSRRTQDAIGRGLAHSAIHGHTHQSQNRLLVPSILYEDAKTAADVPLTTLRENAYSAWQVLLANESTTSSIICDEKYKKLMNLSSLQCERGLLTPPENQQLNRLIRPVLFWIGSILLNESSNRSPTSPYMNGLHVLEYLLRRHDVHIHNGRELILSLLPHHSEALFGRVLQLVDIASIPEFTFLRPYATPGTTVLPNKIILATQTSKDKTMVKLLCDLAQFFGCQSSSSYGRRNKVMSFVCEILAKALYLQVRRLGTCEETTVRLMMPYLLQACSSADEEFQAFGDILVSTLSEYVEFSKEMLEKLTKVIWQNTNGNNIETKLILLIGLIPPSETLILRYKNKPLKAIRINPSIVLSSEKYDAEVVLPPVVGHIYSEKQFASLASFVMFLLDWSFESGTLAMILALVKEPSLKQIWSNVLIHAVTETLVQFVVSSKQEDENDEDNTTIQASEKILKELRHLNTNTFNQAVAHEVMKYRDSDIAIKQCVAQILSIKLPSSSSSKDASLSGAELLPPRVALEHADASVRRQAMHDLATDNAHDDYDDTMIALLRHVSIEEEPTMILAAAQALEQLDNATKGNSLSQEFEEQLTDTLLQKGEELEDEIVSILIKLVKNKTIDIDDDNKNTNGRLVTYLVAQSSPVTSKDKKEKTKGKNALVETAIQCLGNIFFDDKGARDETILVQSSVLLDFVVKAKNSCSKDLQRKAIMNIIHGMNITHPQVKDENNNTMPYNALEAWIDTLVEGEDSTTIIGEKKKTVSAIKKCVKLVIKHEDDDKILQLITKAVSVPSDTLYKKLLLPALLETAITSTSSIMLFMEAALQLSTPSTVVRLLSFLTGKKEYFQKEAIVIIPMLALMGHDDSTVRQAALDLYDNLSEPPFREVSKSSILLDGATALPDLLRNNNDNDPAILLKHCATICQKWINFRGHQRALAIVLSSTELAGEASFSLDNRWALAGELIFQKLLDFDDKVLDESSSLVEAVVRMFKGALINDASEIFNLVIVKGSSRSRSYSVGRASGVSLADPYPDGMVDALVKSLTLAGDDESDSNCYIASHIISTVFGSDSWCNIIFKDRLNSKDRMRITNQLLLLQTVEANKAFLRLPLPAGDLCSLLKEHTNNLVALATLLDYIRSSSSSSTEVANGMFSVLESISSSDIMLEDDNGMDFVRHSTLSGLSEYCHTSSTLSKTRIRGNKLVVYTKLLVALIGGGSTTFDAKNNAIHPLTSWKSKRTALSVLSALCAQDAAKVVPSMLAAFLNCIEEEKESSSSRSETIKAIVPVFHQYCAQSKFSMVDLLIPFLDRTSGSNAVKFQQSMVNALSSLKQDDCSVLADFMCLLLARRVTKVYQMKEFLENLEPVIQINCVRKLCARLDVALIGQSVSNIVESPTSQFCMEVSGLILQTLSNKLVQGYIQESDVSSLCLQLWQDLMVLQATSIQQANTHGDDKMFTICKNRIDESLIGVQHLLPIPVFLASVTTLIEDDEGNSDLCKSRALRMISERISEVDPMAPEAALFTELLPLILGLLQNDANDSDVIVQQDAAVVIERFVRSFYLLASVQPKKSEGSILEALKVCAERLSELCSQKEDDIRSKLACSFALCTATLVKYLKARSLPLLPKIMDSVINFLSFRKLDCGDGDTQPLVHASMLQTLKAIIESLPQFMIPHLGKILTPAILPSFLNESNDIQATLTTRVPARQLLPALSRALKECCNATEYEIILSLATSSIENTSSRHEIGAVKANVLKIILLSCDFDASLMDQISKALVAMVMKISEAQLRQIYTSFREWRGDDNSSRKFAFWALSAALSKELKSIFIPCFTSVLNDAISELEFAVPLLCTQIQRAKKAKVGSMDSLLYLPALISCLNQIFSADAREGGNWVREDGDKRYHSFLEPLTKLLLARVPSDFPFPTGASENAYQQLIVDSGGLVSCIVSLASAAGNDILWKPLNHAILIACGNEDHAEIRRAGLTCLLELIRTLGEEYMVLIPECLPVLSELLEAEEETAALARDCVELSEDLLGESLEESL